MYIIFAHAQQSGHLLHLKLTRLKAGKKCKYFQNSAQTNLLVKLPLHSILDISSHPNFTGRQLLWYIFFSHENFLRWLTLQIWHSGRIWNLLSRNVPGHFIMWQVGQTIINYNWPSCKLQYSLNGHSESKIMFPYLWKIKRKVKEIIFTWCLYKVNEL